MADAAKTRPGEALDVAAVDAWLRTCILGLSAEMPRVTQYSGGASNWTYRLEYASDDFVLRRPPAGTKAHSAHDMAREFTVQQCLAAVYPHVPDTVVYCADESLIGTDFYVMRRVDGPIPRKEMPEGARMDAAGNARLCRNAVDLLAKLHAVDPKRARLAHLGRGPGYARRQVEGWTERYARARTWNVPRFAKVTDWLRANAPDDVGTCIIHNDFRLDNLVLDRADPANVVAVLDWEMATIGDPAMDLGNTLAYWVQADDDLVMRTMRRQPTHLPGMLTRREVVERYAERTGLRPPAGWTFYEVYGLFRLAGIVQQIYYRYHRRETRNRAFRHFWIITHALERRCRALIRG